MESDCRFPCELIIANFNNGELLIFFKNCGLLLEISAELHSVPRGLKLCGVFGEFMLRLMLFKIGADVGKVATLDVCKIFVSLTLLFLVLPNTTGSQSTSNSKHRDGSRL